MLEEGYVREQIIIEKNEIEKEKQLIRSIMQTKEELSNASINFEYAEDEKLVDYYIYQIKANQAKLDHLIKKAKDKGIELNMIDEKRYMYENNEDVS